MRRRDADAFGPFQQVGTTFVQTFLTSSTNTEYLKHRLALLGAETFDLGLDRLTERGIPLGRDP